MTTPLDLPPLIAPERPIKRVQFYGRNREPFLSRDGEVLVSGPAGTGKTMTLLTKMFLAAEKHPGMRGLICRKTRESLSEAALVTWETKVLPSGHSALNGPSRRIRQSYKFANGSEIIIGGLDKSQKVMSTEYDMIYVQEAIELTENDWENLTTRLRNGKMPYQQIIADTNPDRPTHWLKRRCDAGKTKLIESRHEDNPSVIDPKTNQPTAAGRVYLGKLDALTGPRKARLRYGRWVQSEGVVYEGYDPAVHVVPPFKIPHEWKRYWSIDFGYTNPFACLWFAEDPDGRLFLYREIYRTQTLVQDHAREILRESGAWNAREFRPDWYQKNAEPRPLRVISDHDAEDRATLEKYLGMKVTPADKVVSPGIQAVTARLKPAGDGRPRLFFFADSLCHRPDSNLVEAKKPTRLSEEFDGYIWSPTGKEEPVKVDDHACFVAGTSIACPAGDRPIEDVRSGDKVMTHLGIATVVAALKTATKPIVRVHFADGRHVDCTGDHPLAKSGGGWVPAQHAAGVLIDVMRCETWKLSTTNARTGQPLKKCFGKVIGGFARHIAKPRTDISGDRFGTRKQTSCGTDGCIERVGPWRCAQPLKAWLCTMSTKTLQTTTLKTWKFTPQHSTVKSTATTCKKPAKRLRNGMAALMGWLGMLITPNAYLRTFRLAKSLAVIAARNPAQPKLVARSFAATHAGPQTEDLSALMTNRDRASSVDLSSRSTVTAKRNAARGNVAGVYVREVKPLPGVSDVYNLATSHGTYFANGVLVSNCDALRYTVVAVDGRPIPLTAANVSVGDPIAAAGAPRRTPQGRTVIDTDDEPDSLFERMQS